MEILQEEQHVSFAIIAAIIIAIVKVYLLINKKEKEKRKFL